jgi:hypothetical protein
MAIVITRVMITAITTTGPYVVYLTAEQAKLIMYPYEIMKKKSRIMSKGYSLALDTHIATIILAIIKTTGNIRTH